MFRPNGGPRGIGSAWSALAVALLFAGLGVASPVAAADSHTRIKIAQSGSDVFGPEERAQELYLDAMEKLDAGLNGPARAMLADLIAKYPRTEAASVARRHFGTPGTAPVREAAVVPANAVAPAPAPPAPPTISVGSGPRWDQELRRNGAIQSRLRVDAGDRVFFSPGSATLGTRAHAALAAQARWLKRWTEFEVAIEGHADEDGISEQDDVRLSQARAQAVRRRLIAEGVAPDRLAIVAQGSAQPVAICDASECHAQNRRVVTLVFASGTTKRLGLKTTPSPGAAGKVAAVPSGSERSPLAVPAGE